MTDPYKVLGISPSASDDELKKAYRELAKKYHPDNYVNNPLKDLADEKMKEINEAYDKIINDRKNGRDSYSSGSSNNSTSFSKVRQMIANGDFLGADSILNSTTNRNAEWYYLKSCVYQSQQRYAQARSYLERACAMDPTNLEYRTAYTNLMGASHQYGGFNTQRTGAECDICDLCSALWCADCMCECCGGDLIGCC